MRKDFSSYRGYAQAADETAHARPGATARPVSIRLAIAMALVAVVAGALPFAISKPDPAEAAPPSRSAKVTICHRTRSTTNPYRRITVSKNAVKNTGHGGHTGVPWVTTNTNGQVWGDIIPDVDTNGNNLPGNPKLNYSDRGLAIYQGTSFGGVDYAGRCGAMTTKDFIRVHLDSGGTLSAAMTELDSMAAADDDALKQSVGTTFTSWYVSLGSPTSLTTLESAIDTKLPLATTDDATNVGTPTANAATLNATISPRGVGLTVWFEYGTDATLVTNTKTDSGLTLGGAAATTIAAGNSGTVLAVLPLTPLVANTTYFYRIVILSTSGSGDDAVDTVTNGSIVPFTLGTANQLIDFPSLSGSTYGTNVSIQATSKDDDEAGDPNSGLTVAFTSTDASVCTVGSSSISSNVTSAVVTPVSIGTCTIRATQAGGTGVVYNTKVYRAAASVSRSFTISAKALTISSGVTGSNKQFDGGESASVTCGTLGLSGVVAGDSGFVQASCTSPGGTFDNRNVGDGKTVTVSGVALTGGRANRYSITATTTANITVRGLIVTADDKSKASADPNPTFTAVGAGLQGSDSLNSATTTYTFTGTGSTSYGPSTVVPTSDGTYSITPSAAGFSSGVSSNYAITYTAGTYTIAASLASQTVTFGALGSKTYGDTDFTIEAISKDSSNNNTGLEVALTSLTSGICTVSGRSLSAGVTSATVSVLAQGNCQIRASQAGGASGGTTYASAAAVTQAFTVNPKSITVTADNKSKTAGDSDPTFTVSVAGGFVGSDAVNGATNTFQGSGSTSYGPSTTAPSSAGSYTITPSVATFSSGSSANYTISYVAGTYTINAAGGGGGGGGPATTVAAATTTTTTQVPRRITICHATGSASNPYVQITVDAAGLNGHGDHAGDIIPAPAGGCSARAIARAAASTATTLVPRRISICHATGSATNPYVEITVDVEGLNGHGDHEGDIIPAPAGGCSTEAISAQRVTTTTAPRRITICHATGSATNPYVEITVDANGLNGHGDHDGDIIPAPAGGCPSRLLRDAQRVTPSTTPRRITICHATGSASNPYVEITVDANSLSGHGDHPGDIIPAPAGGCGLNNVLRTIATTTTLPAGSLGRTQQQVNDTRNGGQNQIIANNLQISGTPTPAPRGGGGNGGQGGTITLQPRLNSPSPQLLNVRTSDPRIRVEVRSSGANYNQPSTWVNEGFGSYCWKIEPFADSDYTYVLPNPSAPPDAAYAGLPYSAVVVKAGSVVESDPAYQANTVFMNPSAGATVFADVNKNGVSDPGGQGGGLLGDKSISHIVLCVGDGEFPEIAVTTTTVAGGSGTTTTTVAGGSGTTTTTVAGGSGTTTTTVAGGSGTTTTTVSGGSGTTTTTVAGGSGTTTTTTTTIAPGASSPTTTSPGATPSTLPEGSPPSAPPPLQILLSAPLDVPLPPRLEVELFLTTGTANERLVLTVFTESFEIPEPYSTPLLFELPETGVTRWTDRQMYGFGFITFGLGLWMFGATRRLRRR